MPQIKSDQCYKVPKMIVSIDPSQIPNNWLNLLLEKLQFENKEEAGREIKEHLEGKKQSSNPLVLAKELDASLRLLYQQIIKKNPASDQLAVFREKFLEAYPFCTDGFVDRVNDCNLSFSMLPYFDESLWKLRETLVEECIIQLGISEIHATHHVKKLAKPYGILLLNQDYYQGDTNQHTNEQINTELQKTFASNYQFFRIISHIYQSIQFSLGHAEKQLKQLEFNSRDYNSTHNRLIEQLSELFPGKLVNELLDYDEESLCFQGIKWNSIKQSVLDYIDQDHYIKLTERESACLKEITTEPFSEPLAKEFFNLLIANNAKELGCFWNLYPQIDPRTQAYLIQFLPKEQRLQALIDLYETFYVFQEHKKELLNSSGLMSELESVDLLSIISDQHHKLTSSKLTCLLELLSFIPDRLVMEYKLRNSLQSNLFHIAAARAPWVFKILAEMLKKQGENELLKQLLREINAPGITASEYLVTKNVMDLKLLKEIDPEIYFVELNILMHDQKKLNACLSHGVLIDYLADMPLETRRRILRDYNTDGMNLLIHIAKKKPESFNRLFQLIVETNPELAWIMLTEKDATDKRNALMIMIRSSHAVDSALQFIQNQKNISLRNTILTTTDDWLDNKWNLLMYASYYISFSSMGLLFQLFNELDSSKKTEILTNTSQRKTNALIIACCKQEDITPLIHLIQNTENATRPVLSQIAVCGNTVLHIASDSNYEKNLSQICTLLATLDHKEQMHMLGLGNHSHQTPLMLAAEKRKDINCIIEIIKKWDKKDKVAFLKKEQQQRALEIAKKYQPKVFRQLLDLYQSIMTDLPVDQLLKILQYPENKELFIQYIQSLEPTAARWKDLLHILIQRSIQPGMELPILRAWINPLELAPLPIGIFDSISDSKQKKDFQDLSAFYNLLCDFQGQINSLPQNDPSRVHLNELKGSLHSALKRYAGQDLPHDQFVTTCQEAFAACPEESINKHQGIKKIVQFLLRAFASLFFLKPIILQSEMKQCVDTLKQYSFFKDNTTKDSVSDTPLSISPN